jgi:hypothetical protein
MLFVTAKPPLSNHPISYFGSPGSTDQATVRASEITVVGNFHLFAVFADLSNTVGGIVRNWRAQSDG